MRHVKKAGEREKTRTRRGSVSIARVFGAAEGAAAALAEASKAGAAEVKARASEAATLGAGTGREMTRKASSMFSAAAANATAALNASLAAQPEGGAAAAPSSSGPSVKFEDDKTSGRVELGGERRSLHQSSPWIVHLAPCIIQVPTGGLQAKHVLQVVSTSRICIDPDKTSPSSPVLGAGARGIHMANGAIDTLDGAPLQLFSTPNALKPALVGSLMKKLSAQRFNPDEELLSSASPSLDNPSVYFVLSGQIACDVDPTPKYDRFSADIDAPHDDPLLLTAGEPFTTKDPLSQTASASQVATLLSPPAGAALGEWLLLQPGLMQMPRVIAKTAVSTVSLTERDLSAAMQVDEQLLENFWWGRAQRETFCFLQSLEPFCFWHHSKLWRWVSHGRHIKVPEGKGQLGVQCPFVVLVQGRCHVMYHEHEIAITREDTAGRMSVDGNRRRLGSMRLLGSGTKISDIFSQNRHPGSPSRGAPPGSPESRSGNSSPTGMHQQGGKWVPGPDVIHCHDEIAYHFARDSLVFVPSDKLLQWLPQNYVFSTPQIGGVIGGMPAPSGWDPKSHYHALSA